MKELGLKNSMEAPRLKKIVVNSGIGPFRENKEAVESFVEDLSDFTVKSHIREKQDYRKLDLRLEKVILLDMQ